MNVHVLTPRSGHHRSIPSGCYNDLKNPETDCLLIKAVLMFCIVYSSNENPLLTMGDAVASFLDKRDITTNSTSLLSIRDIKRVYSAGATTWDHPRRRWKDAASKQRRMVTVVLYGFCNSPCLET